MRSTLENNPAFDLFLKSGKFSSAYKAMTGDATITSNGQLYNYYDPEGVDRAVRLPPLESGRFFVISNVGTDGKLTINSYAGTFIEYLDPGQTGLYFSTDVEWKTVDSQHDFGPTGPNHDSGLVPDPGPGPVDPDPANRRYLSELGWTAIPGLEPGNDYYKLFKGGAVTLTPVASDTLEFTSANNLLTILASAATTPDEIRFTVNQGNINHDALSGYVADQHVPHSLVSVFAGLGLAGGGTIAASRTLNLDVNNLTGEAPELADYFPFYDVSGTDTNKGTFTALNGILDHNALVNYSADRHVAHSAVSIVAGTGLSGGGDITTSRILSLDINGLSADTPAVTDMLVFYDVSEGDTHKMPVTTLNGVLDHDALINYAANEHFPDAPSDGVLYARRTNAWAALPNITVGPTPPPSPGVNDVWIDTT